MRTFLLILVAIVAISALGHSTLANANFAASWPDQKRVERHAYALSASGPIAIYNVSGNVEVDGWDSDRVELTVTKTAWSSDDLDRLESSVERMGAGLAVRAIYPDRCFNCDISFVMRVPHGAHVTVQSSSGDVSVKSVTGPDRVDTSSGDITLRDVSGETHLHSSSGTVTINGADSLVDVDTSSGDINATNLSQDANLVASSGELKAEFAKFDAVKNVRMATSSGDITLLVPRGVGFKVEANTNSGSIDSNLRLPIRDRDSGADVSAQVGDGKASVQLSTGSGDIAIKMR